MFTKVLIANRGAIAVRIIRTLKKMGITSVAVYSDADKNSLHVRQADEAYALGAGNASETYLQHDKLFSIIQLSGAQAVHPGYGFLSENSEFVTACEVNGVAFIGPTADQMVMFGLKHKARALAEKNNVPLLKGSSLLHSLDDAISAAKVTGYPVMLKSTAGGGGIGMQVCDDEGALVSAFDSVKRLSGNNFSNDGVFIEKYIEFARHIEVQIFGDGNGGVITLGERDCSTQRRHQKVIEETPAPNLTNDLREQLYRVSKTLMRSVNYRNAGTVEFIFDQKEKQFYFLEVNTRLQVEHGVTELVYGVDIVEWMVQLAANAFEFDRHVQAAMIPNGHAMQARIYAEDANKNFQPCAGLLSYVNFPNDAIKKNLIDNDLIDKNTTIRIDHWIESGVEVSAFYDPMLAKVMVHSTSRNQAIEALKYVLDHTIIEGIETNKHYIKNILHTHIFAQGDIYTRYSNHVVYQPATLDILSGGTQTTIQDYPGRTGYWDVGVPPSGPFDNLALRLGNRLLGNATEAAGLEVTLVGPVIKFNQASTICLTGALFTATLDNIPVTFGEPIQVNAQQVLNVGKPCDKGARCYVTLVGGIQSTPYLGSRSTFTLGQFGGFSGRALRTGDVIHMQDAASVTLTAEQPCIGKQKSTLVNAYKQLSNSVYNIRVIYGPHGAPDFFTDEDISSFFKTDWEIHYNSSRTGIRLIGPKPQWARSDGGEAGMHPSNIHDNAYAVGAIDFTGDMPVILGPDGPSLGGFVCPATVISADLWKLGQLKAGDKIRFLPISLAEANKIETNQKKFVSDLHIQCIDAFLVTQEISTQLATPILHAFTVPDSYYDQGVPVVYRAAGDHYLLVEYGKQELDIRLRFRAHALMLLLQKKSIAGLGELTPGIRSLQIHYDSLTLSTASLIEQLITLENALVGLEDMIVPSRIVHIPLSWNDKACQLAVEKYMHSVRKDAPWCPDNIEFIRRINGLDSVQEVKDIVFNASYVVMGLGDVYLGAPVATPLDPRHRLVTTKYNPARTWTAENSVGIGGSYLCVYGMEGPGGYQFVGRTLQMWNRFHQTKEFTNPWLLRFFDQIRFYEVSDDELLDIREKFPRGDYPIEIEQTIFSLKEHQQYIENNASDIQAFTEKRNLAFAEELERWVQSGQIHFTVDQQKNNSEEEIDLSDGCEVIESHVAGNIWQLHVKEGDCVKEGDVLCVLESMKMEIDITSPFNGKVTHIVQQEGQQVSAGQRLLVIHLNPSY